MDREPAVTPPPVEAPSIPEATLKELIREGEVAWEEFRSMAKDRHHLFIPCDQLGAYEELRNLTARATTFVEFGSAAGVITILASLLGFEAYGIEMEPWLVERSMDLADEFGSTATFAEGTFVPPQYEDEIEHLSADFLTPTAGAYALEELGFELTDFDLVFAYPWPGDELWLQNLVRQHGRPDTILLTYDARDGFLIDEGP